jgi:hypothetical protein
MPPRRREDLVGKESESDVPDADRDSATNGNGGEYESVNPGELTDEVCRTSAERLRALCDAFVRSAKQTLQRQIELGLALVEEQDRIGHGRWEAFVRNYLPFSVKTAQRLQKLGKNAELLQSDEFKKLSMTRALKLLAKPQQPKSSPQSDTSEAADDGSQDGHDRGHGSQNDADDGEGDDELDADDGEEGARDEDVADEDEQGDLQDEEAEEDRGDVPVEPQGAAIHPILDDLVASGYWTFSDDSGEGAAVNQMRDALRAAALDAAENLYTDELEEADYSIQDIAEALAAYVVAHTDAQWLISESASTA